MHEDRLKASVTSVTSVMSTYFEQVQQAVNKLDVNQLAKVVEVLLEAHQRGATIYLFGNGGSATTASHFATDLAKGCIVESQPRFRALALTDNVALLTAWANDMGYENIFAEQLRNLVRPGDVVIGISGSGNSPNVLKAIEVGHQAGAFTIGLSGYGGGKLRHLVDLAVITDCTVMEQVEDIHLSICHNLSTTLRSLLSLNHTPIPVSFSEVASRPASTGRQR